MQADRPTDGGQPRLGLVGLLLVLPIAALLALGWGGAEGSVVVLGPLVTYSLPVAVMIAFWWEDWPGTRLAASLAGWANTLLIVLAAVVLTGVGQVIAGGFHLAGLFETSPGAGQVPTFPLTQPLGGAAFIVMLQLTLVGEGWPLRRLPGLTGGVIAVLVAWVVALILYFGLVDVAAPPGSGAVARDGPIDGADFGAALVVIGALQVLFYVVWNGWPFAGLRGTARRLCLAHAVVVGGGIAAFLLADHALAVDPPQLSAAAGCFVAAGLVTGMLFEGWFAGPPTVAQQLALLAATLIVAVAIDVTLYALASGFSFVRATSDEWVEQASLNAIAFSVILHVAIGRRWPFAAVTARPAAAT